MGSRRGRPPGCGRPRRSRTRRIGSAGEHPGSMSHRDAAVGAVEAMPARTRRRRRTARGLAPVGRRPVRRARVHRRVPGRRGPRGRHVAREQPQRDHVEAQAQRREPQAFESDGLACRLAGKSGERNRATTMAHVETLAMVTALRSCRRPRSSARQHLRQPFDRAGQAPLLRDRGEHVGVGGVVGRVRSGSPRSMSRATATTSARP